MRHAPNKTSAGRRTRKMRRGSEITGDAHGGHPRAGVGSPEPTRTDAVHTSRFGHSTVWRLLLGEYPGFRTQDCGRPGPVHCRWPIVPPDGLTPAELSSPALAG